MDIWQSVLDMLAQELTPTAMQTWFSDCKPVDIKDNRLVLHTPNDFKREIITNRFSKNIEKALTDLFATDFQLLILTDEELEEYISDNGKPDTLPEVAGYTFRNFVVGPSNKLAHAAAVAVSEKPGQTYNPLFIYGNSGLGKTHLLLAVGAVIHERNPDARIIYIKGDEFTNDLVRSIQQGEMAAFRNKYRSADLLLMDDIHFIAGKLQTQEEFFHTFNALHEAGKQIVVTSDRPPMEMHKLEDRIRTRLEWGLLVDISPPDLETRMAITRNKAAQLGMVLSDDVVVFIAETITSNIRQIEGVVKKLTAYKELLNKEITVADVKRAIKDVIRMGTYVPTADIIISETARYYGVSEDAIKGQSRQKNFAMARHVAIYLCRTLTGLGLNDIGQYFDGRNHSTILTSVNKIEDMLSSDAAMAGVIRDITSNINSKN